MSAVDYLTIKVYPTLLPGLEALLKEVKPAIDRTVTELAEEEDGANPRGLHFLAEVSLQSFLLICTHYVEAY